MNLFEFYKIREVSLLDKVEHYIKNKNIKNLSLNVDYTDIKIIDLHQLYPTLKEYYKKYGGLVYAKGYNYKIYQVFVSSNTFEEFINKVKKNISEKNGEFLNRNYKSLEDIKKYIKKPERLLLIEADTKEEVKEIARVLNELQIQIKNVPELLHKRIIKKICNILNKKEEIGLEIGNFFK